LHLALKFRLPDDTLRYIYRCYPQALRERDASGCVPLHYIERNYHREDAEHEMSLATIQFFVGEWPESLQQKNRSQQLVLHAAVASDILPVQVIRFLVESHPQSVQEKDGSGCTPLLAAAPDRRNPIPRGAVSHGTP
jgi:hypothetical protein